MKKRTIHCALFLIAVMFSMTVFAQNKRTITGVVTDSANKPLSNISVLLKNSPQGTITSDAGAFSISAATGDTLVFSALNYLQQEVIVGEQSTYSVQMQNSKASDLGEVVVTALGIKRSEKSLGYATQQVSNQDLTRVKTDNLMNALNGKVAGVTITPSAGGIGGATKVILRGNRSLAGNNQPLYVIDGVPISNNSRAPLMSANSSGVASNPTGNGAGLNALYGGSPDQGDGISNLNPNDIESLTILEGASAAALYGSQAANGVIVITTKKGKAGHIQMNYSSSATFDHTAYRPKFQNSYGPATTGALTSWGTTSGGISGTDNLKDYFQTGNNFTNGINLSGGNEIAQTYFSYANTTARGIQPTNKLQRNNFNFREIGHFLDSKLTVDVNINYLTQKINNSPAIGTYFNPLVGLYLFPRGQDISPYKSQYEFADSTGYSRQNWITQSDDSQQQNPWWILHRNPNTSNRNRLIINASVKYDFTKWLSLQARGNIDRTADTYEQDLYSGTISTLSKANGQFSGTNQTLTQKYGDLILTFKVPNKSPFKIDGLIGTSINDSKTEGFAINPGLGLVNPNLFIIQNIEVAAANTSTPTVNSVSTLPDYHSQIQSIFGNLNLSYNDWLYLTLNGRNDWSSNLAFTNTNHYFYPSASLSVLMNQALHLPNSINYLKLRGSVSQVGNTVPPYVTNVVNYLNAAGNAVINSTSTFRELKPEKTNAVEAGLDLRTLENRLSFSFTWYKTNTKNQFISFNTSVATGYGLGFLNVGNIQNTGVEFKLGYDVVKTDKFNWNTTITASSNKNKILTIDDADNINQILLTNSQGGSFNYESVATKGGSYGDIYGYKATTDAQGRVMLNSNGEPYAASDATGNKFFYLGNPAPKFQLGWNNSFDYKNFQLGFLVDGKFGGQVMSLTQAYLDQYGVSKETGDARAAGGVKVNAVDASGNAQSTVDAKSWYGAIGGRNGITGEYMYSATVVRLRELSLGYSFPFTTGPIKALRLSLIGRNLIYFYRKAPFDPELAMSTGNGMAGVDLFNQPATRSMGLSLNVTF